MQSPVHGNLAKNKNVISRIKTGNVRRQTREKDKVAQSKHSSEKLKMYDLPTHIFKQKSGSRLSEHMPYPNLSPDKSGSTRESFLPATLRMSIKKQASFSDKLHANKDILAISKVDSTTSRNGPFTQ